MATVYEQWSRLHAIADKAAVAPSLERKNAAGGHDRNALRYNAVPNSILDEARLLGDLIASLDLSPLLSAE